MSQNLNINPGIAYSTSIGANTFASPINWTTYPPRKAYSFNEHSMLLQDNTNGVAYRVLYWASWTEMAAMRECWRFEVEDLIFGGGRNILMVPESACEAYLKPGSRRPQPDAAYLREPPGHPVQAGKTPPTSKEDEMLRKNFTFTYTGTEISNAINAKVDALNEQKDVLLALDITALKDAGVLDSYSAEDVKSKIKIIDTKMEKWNQEQRPYDKAGDKEFDLDSEDVEHFGL